MPQVMKAQTRDGRSANRLPERLLESTGGECSSRGGGGALKDRDGTARFDLPILSDMIGYYYRTKPMKPSSKYRAIAVTVPSEMEKALEEVCRKEIRKKSEVVTEALRLYFRARGGKAQLWSLVMPTVEEERAQADYGAFADEWGSEHDAVYDKLGK
jgi:hypothetical protein